jgi:hypothetical protein
MSLLLFFALFATSGPSVEVRTLDGETVSGHLVGLTANQVDIETSEGPVTLETETVKDLAPSQSDVQPPKETGTQVKLADGCWLSATDYSVSDGRASITTLSGTSVEVAARDVASVRLQTGSDDLRSEWSDIVDSEPDTDLLVVRGADALDYHGGIVKGVTDTVVEFEMDGEALPVKRSKVFGMVYYQSAGRNLPDSVCTLIESGGSRWEVRSLQLEGDDVRWTTPLGLELESRISALERIDFSQDKILYLSDIEPDSEDWTPHIGMDDRLGSVAKLMYLPRQDRGRGKNPLQLEQKSYTKGVALHSRTEVVYRLPGRFRRLRATAGIDDTVRPHGNLVLVIRGDGRLLLDRVIAGSDPPLEIDLDIAGVRRLAILVDFGENQDIADHLDLCEARVVK